MVFSSPSFFLFFFLYFLLHLAVPVQHRLKLVIIGGTIFYGYWDYRLFWIPHLLTALAYGGVRWFDAAKTPPARKTRMTITIGAVLLPLLVFKYAKFFYSDVLGPIIGLGDRMVDLPLPLGLSFLTFSLIAYIVDVYNDRHLLERRPSLVLGYALFFPHSVAGPILRPQELIPQLEHSRPALDASFKAGIMLFSLGLLKKVVFADSLANVVDPVYAKAFGLTAWHYLLAIYGFTVQIYCDFSGYTDMAIGCALVLGVELPINFKQPFLASSVADFWRRWHITLGHWLRIYLYAPLLGLQPSFARRVWSIMITMGLVGLWHGANWTFIVFGLLHGIGIVAAHLTRRTPWLAWVTRLPNWFKVVLTFHFFAFTLVLFRAPGFAAALEVFKGLFTAPTTGWASLLSRETFTFLLFFFFFLTHKFDNHDLVRSYAERFHPRLVWTTVAALWVVAIGVGTGGSGKFIYFDF